jgi:hypothetical protein
MAKFLPLFVEPFYVNLSTKLACISKCDPWDCVDANHNLCSMPCYCSAAIACLGGMYEKLGRMVGRSYEETISLLVKALKNAEVCKLLHSFFNIFVFHNDRS